MVALSGGFSREDACRELAKNPGMIASFSRALLSDLRAQQSDEEFDRTLGTAIDEIYQRVDRQGPGLTLDESHRDSPTLSRPANAGRASSTSSARRTSAGAFPDRLKAALEPGIAAAFQLRVKDVDEHQLARLAEPLQRICADADVAFIVNDSMALAKRLGADGVHLGQSDGDIREARALLGPLGADRQNLPRQPPLRDGGGGGGRRLCRVRRFLSDHDEALPLPARPVDPDLVVHRVRNPLRRDRRNHPDNAKPLVEAGADFLAVVQAVWGKDDPAEAVRAFGPVLKSRAG